jgi:predicted nucleic acid-binding protein
VKYLVDSSALTRIIRRQADPAWDDAVGHGLLSLCEPVLAETLLIAPTKEYAATEEALARVYVPVTIPDRVWDMTAAIRRDLAQHSAHAGLSVADLIVAATAIQLKLTVLHEDGDFETIARFVPELRERRISAGPE